MTTLLPEFEALIVRAAELRAAGVTWEVVAREVQRNINTVRAWPRSHPDLWRKSVREAEKRLLADASAEAVYVLRQLLRSEDEKVRRDSARSLIDLYLAHEKQHGEAAKTENSSNHFAQFVEGLDDAELAKLAGTVPAPLQDQASQ